MSVCNPAVSIKETHTHIITLISLFFSFLSKRSHIFIMNHQHPLANHHQHHYAPPPPTTHYTTASSSIVQPHHHHHQFNFDFASPMYAHHHPQQTPAHIPAAVQPVTNTSTVTKDAKQQKPKRKQVKNACGRLCHMNAFRALFYRL